MATHLLLLLSSLVVTLMMPLGNALADPPPLPAGINKAQIDLAARDAGYTMADYPYHRTPNGCSRDVATSEGQPISDLWFKKACDAHDICYSTLGFNKTTCDNALQADLQASCDITTKADKKTCENGARIFYDALRTSSEQTFNATQEQQHAYELWVENYLSSRVATLEITGVYCQLTENTTGPDALSLVVNGEAIPVGEMKSGERKALQIKRAFTDTAAVELFSHQSGKHPRQAQITLGKATIPSTTVGTKQRTSFLEGSNGYYVVEYRLVK